MFTYKKAPYINFALDPKFCWAGPACHISICNSLFHSIYIGPFQMLVLGGTN